MIAIYNQQVLHHVGDLKGVIYVYSQQQKKYKQFSVLLGFPHKIMMGRELFGGSTTQRGSEGRGLMKN